MNMKSRMMKKTMTFILIAMMLVSGFVFNTDNVCAASVTSSTYKINVNTKTNVVTVYKKYGDKYKPYRAMVCSSGGKKTPLGTFKLKSRMKWCLLVGDVWGQYNTVIDGDYLFHSVPYKKKAKNAVIGEEYNKLGTSCSHGCIRLAVMDAKWIYDNCPSGTKVRIFRSDSEGPLGKPKPIKVKNKLQWDPTDPDKKNPNFKIRTPEINISSEKTKIVPYGNKYNIRQYVTAKNINAYQDITSLIKVSSVKKYVDGKWLKSTFSTYSPGKYRITYSVYTKYCGKTAYKSFDVNVIDKSAPVITDADRNAAEGDENTVLGVISTHDAEEMNVSTIPIQMILKNAQTMKH